MSATRKFPEPDFERLRDPEADEGHHALLDACIRQHKKRPHVWQRVCVAARDKIENKGRTHATIQACIEDARELAEDNRTTDERAKEFMIANGSAAFISRAMADVGIVPPNFFDFNEQPSKKRKAPKKKQTPADVKPDPTRPGKRGKK